MVLVNNCVGDSVWRFMQPLKPLYLWIFGVYQHLYIVL